MRKKYSEKQPENLLMFGGLPCILKMVYDNVYESDASRLCMEVVYQNCAMERCRIAKFYTITMRHACEYIAEQTVKS